MSEPQYSVFFSSSVFEWDAEKVSKWISNLGLGLYAANFIENNVTGDALIYLEQPDLSEIGVRSVGHRIRILKAIYELKVSQEIQIDPDHYIPPTVHEARRLEAKGTTIDPPSIIHSFEIRDERIGYAENEIRKLLDGFARLREDLLPVFRLVKESKPLPTPEAPGSLHPPPPQSQAPQQQQQPQSSNNNPSSHQSPTIASSSSAMAPSLPSLSTSIPAASPSPTNHQTPISATGDNSGGNGGGSGGGVKELLHKKSFGALSMNSIKTTNPGSELLEDIQRSKSVRRQQQKHSTSSKGGSAAESLKSFRVSMEDPCYKVLPAALRKYGINADWQDYALLVSYEDKERTLGLDEKPLIIFKELQDAGKKPMFMLRHIPDMWKNHPYNSGGVMMTGTPGGVL